MPTTLFDTVAVLLVIAAVFGYLNHKLIKLPFAIGIMVGGLLSSFLVIGAAHLYPGIVVDELARSVLSDIDFAEALMHGMLSFLLFAGALHTDMDTLKRWAAPILTLASVGVLISTFLIGFAAYGVFAMVGEPVALPYCLVFGALITPTDPVAVLGIMKAAGAPEDVEIKVVGESLFNDGVGVVVFSVLVAIAAGGAGAHGSPDVAGVAMLIAQEVVGGVLLGLGAGYLTYLSLRTLDEPNLEVLISVALVMGITFLAFQVHTSAPLACVVAGLFIGNHGRHEAMSDDTESAVDTVWSFIDEALNAVLFLLVGLEMFVIDFETHYLFAALILVVLSLLARGVAVFVPMQLLARKLEFLPGTKRILWWGGIKGGISIALALSLPPFEGRDIILAVSYSIVIASVLLQGLTIGTLVKKFA